MKPIFSRTLLTLLLAFSAQPLLVRYALAQATAHDSGNLTVKATVVSSCALAVATGDATMEFGEVGAAAVDKDVTASFKIQCTQALPYSIGLGAGEGAIAAAAGASGNTAQRRMTKRVSATNTTAATGTGSDSIPYQLYRSTVDRTAGTQWGQDNTNVLAGPTGGATGTQETISVYGKVPLRSTAPSPGYYQDVVKIYMIY